MTDRLGIYQKMQQGMTQEQAMQKSLEELISLIVDLKAENEANARAFHDARGRGDHYRQLWLEANEVIEQRNAELSRGRADFMQPLLDPENQPSQWGTVTLAWHEAEVERLTEAKDGAYLERNKLVALLSKVFPSGKKRTAIEGWSDDWHGCVYIDLPTGQASWHYHDSQEWLFAHLPEYQGTWDGHTTDEKYERIGSYLASGAAPKEPT